MHFHAKINRKQNNGIERIFSSPFYAQIDPRRFARLVPSALNPPGLFKKKLRVRYCVERGEGVIWTQLKLFEGR
jgi:hypothetical protein